MILEHKRALLTQLRDRVRTDLAALIASQASAVDGATHAESRAEDPKDTRATEGGYLARVLAQRVQALERALIQLERMPLRAFHDDDPIGLGALVTLEQADRSRRQIFLVPAGGGTRLQSHEVSIAATTPHSPAGRALTGQRLDDTVVVAGVPCEIVALC